LKTLPYGPGESQVADLYLPEASTPPVVCLLHGGFWRLPHGRDQMDGMAADLARRGFAVLNIEYRRIGEARVGWKEIASDVRASLTLVSEVASSRYAVVGHSAGGQLALACAGPDASLVVSLAGVTDLEEAARTNMGAGAAQSLLGGGPAQFPDRYADASPIRRLPRGARAVLIHGTLDDAVPVSLSRDYASAARALGDPVSLIEIEAGGHMDFLDPGSPACAKLRECLEVLRPG